jgi:hypothetical protein
MTKRARDKIGTGLREAIAVARGEEPARWHGHVPNAETVEALKAIERGEVKKFATVEGLLVDLNSDDDD